MIISAFESKMNIEYIRAKGKSGGKNVLVLKSMKFGMTEFNVFPVQASQK